MLYLVYGTQKYLLFKTCQDLVKKLLDNNINDFNYLKLDFNETKFDDILSNISTFPLGVDKKAVLIKNGLNIIKEKQFDDFLDSINNNDDTCDVIIEFLLKRMDEFKTINKKFETIKSKTLVETKEIEDSDWLKYINLRFKKENKTITNEAATELKKRCDGDFEKLNNEIIKLCLYKDNIELNDVNIMVNELIEGAAYDLKSYLLDNKKEEALKLFENLKFKNVEPVILISTLASQFIFIKKVKYLYQDEKMSVEEMAKILDIRNPKRLYFDIKDLNKCKKIDIDLVLNDLYLLDKDIKSNKINRFLGMQLFIINFGGNKYEMSNM